MKKDFALDRYSPAHEDVDKRKEEEMSKFRQLDSSNDKLEAIYAF